MGACVDMRYNPKTKQHFPCGSCEFCLQKDSRDWFIRIYEEAKIQGRADFITLTYSDDNLPYHIDEATGEAIMTLSKKDTRQFIKALLYQQKVNKDVKKLRYFLCGEYSPGKLRPHYHLITFNLSKKTISKVSDIWKKGFVKVGNVKEASIKYVVNYVHTKYQYHPKALKPFRWMSKGLGTNWVEKNGKYKPKVYRLNGNATRLPRLYRDKIFSRVEKDLLKLESVKEMDRLQDNYDRYLAKVCKGSSKSPYIYKNEQIEGTRELINKRIKKSKKL